MAFASTCVVEVRSTGNDANGGAFDPVSGVPGTDFSVQDAAQVAYTDIVIDGTTNTKATSAGHPFTSAHVGNFVNVTAGTGFTVQRVQIMSVTAGAATADKSWGTLSSTGGTGNLGGGLATPGLASSLTVNGMTIYVKSATYTLTTTANVSGGRFSTFTNVELVGYSTNRTLNNTDTRPIFQPNANGVTPLVYMGGTGVVRNIDVENGSAFTGVTGYQFDNPYCLGENLKASAVATGFSVTTGPSKMIACEAVSCTTVGVIVSANGSTIHSTTARSGTVQGFKSTGTGVVFSRCIASVNGGEGFYLGTAGIVIDCDSNANTGVNGTGFFFNNSVADGSSAINCRSVSNAQKGFDATNNSPGLRLYNCATFGNGTAIGTTIAADKQIGCVALSATPYVNAAGLDFSTNATTGGGALCRGAGYPSSFPGLSTSSAPDIGAAQHADPAAGGGISGARAYGGF